MSSLFRFPEAVDRSPAVETWMRWQKGEMGRISRHWFEVMHGCGSDVREVLHDGHPTACVGDAAFAYVDTFSAHVNVGFFFGAQLPDPKNLLEGSGKAMRHVKIRPGAALDTDALAKLVGVAYADMKRRVQNEKRPNQYRRAGFVEQRRVQVRKPSAARLRQLSLERQNRSDT